MYFNLPGYTLDNVVDKRFYSEHKRRKQEIEWIQKLHMNKHGLN